MAAALDAWDRLEPPFRRALELAWESASSLSLGVGAVITDSAGDVVATGRNRLFESDPGADVLAGSPVAHAEMNALAKLRAGADYADHTLWTTLEPCLLCTGGIRLSAIGQVCFLGHDPLWPGLDGIRHLSDHIGSKWAQISGPADGPLAAFGLLLPLHTSAFWQPEGPMLQLYEALVPDLVRLAVDLARSQELARSAEAGQPVAQVIADLWDRLHGACQPPSSS